MWVASGLCHTQLCAQDFGHPIEEDKEMTKRIDMNYRQRALNMFWISGNETGGNICCLIIRRAS